MVVESPMPRLAGLAATVVLVTTGGFATVIETASDEFAKLPVAV